MKPVIRLKGIVSACLLAAMAYCSTLAADAESDMVRQVELVTPCFDCHGGNGISSDSDVPIIAGQPNFFLIDNMLAFQRRERPCRETRYRSGDVSRLATSMCDIVGSLSDDDIQLIAEFFSTRQFAGQTQRTNPALAEAGAAVYREHCAKCHTEGGSIAEDDSGILAGQWMPYLRSALDDYRSGKRVALEEKMQNEIDQLDDSETEALVHYFGSLGG